MEVTSSQLPGDADRQPCQEGPTNTRDVLLKAPFSTTTGGGDEYGSTMVPGQPQWPYPSGEGGDVEANQSEAESGLAPAWSLPSLDFCSAADALLWEGDEAEPSLPLISAETSTSTAGFASPSSGGQEGDDDADEHSMALSLDVSCQRADFRAMPRALSLLRDYTTKSAQRRYFVVQVYQRLRSSDHTSNRSSSSSSYASSTSASPTLPRTHVCALHDASLLPTNKMLQHWVEVPQEPRMEPRIELRHRRTWARLWARLRGRLQQVVKCCRDRAERRRRAGRDLGRRRRDASPAGRQLCSDGQGASSLDNLDEVLNNLSSDDLYKAGAMCWHVRRIYQRSVSYLQALWCWRGL
ncbi:uncharacterized protein [Dermacentor albipictus]|uniref:uncharacterized protein n=1 Tax=Dermacentor albipictus TaxID=60249 RepID=UPI0038FBF525